MTKLSLALIVTMMASPIWAAPEIKGTPDEIRSLLQPRERTVTIQDTAEITAYTDRAILTLTVTTEEDKLAESLTANTTLRNQLRQSMMTAGIAAADIKSARFSTSPQYGWFGDKPDSYQIVNRMSVTITTEEQMKAAAALADKYKEVELSGTRFEHSEKQAYKNKVRNKVLNKIMKQKENYEKRLGVKLTPVAFRDFSVRPVPRPMLLRAQKAKNSRAVSNSVMSESAAMADSTAAMPASFDEVKYSGQLAVDFRIEPAK